MNAEKLHEILRAILTEVQQQDIQGRLGRLRDNLQNSVNQPQQANHQQAVAKERNGLKKVLSSVPSNSASPGWRQILDELGLSPVLGATLLERIESAFQDNHLTPAAARDQLSNILDELGKKAGATANAVQGLEVLGIARDSLAADDSEIGVLIPREFVKSDLEQFGFELIELEKILLPFEELATGSRGGFKVRSISSSDYSVFLNAAVPVAVCVSFVLSKVIEHYKGILEIRKLRNELKNNHVSEAVLERVDADIDQKIVEAIPTIVDEAIEKFAFTQDRGRRNELRIELSLSTKKIAGRIDRGFNFEIRVVPRSEEEDRVPESPEEAEALARLKQVRETAKSLSFMKVEGDPVLKLPPRARAADDAEGEP